MWLPYVGEEKADTTRPWSTGRRAEERTAGRHLRKAQPAQSSMGDLTGFILPFSATPTQYYEQRVRDKLIVT